jgi:hypothetical protein
VLSAPVADEARRARLTAIAEMAWRIHGRFAECLPPRVSERLGDDLGGKGGRFVDLRKTGAGADTDYRGSVV